MENQENNEISFNSRIPLTELKEHFEQNPIKGEFVFCVAGAE